MVVGVRLATMTKARIVPIADVANYYGINRRNHLDHFIINKNQQNNGDHEVHNKTKGCSYMPNSENQIGLGTHSSCHEAVSTAKSQWNDSRINGCYYCCNDCHTS